MIVKTTHSLFLGSLPNTFTVRVLKKFLQKTLKSKFKIKKGKNKGKSKATFAIITVFTDEDKNTLLYKEHFINKTELKFEKYKTEEDLYLEASKMLLRRIYVNNLPHGITEEDVHKIFSKYGDIETIFLKDKEIKGYTVEKVVKCFLTFNDEKSVELCFSDFPIIHQGCKLEIYQKTTPKSRGDKKFIKVEKEKNIFHDAKSSYNQMNNYYEFNSQTPKFGQVVKRGKRGKFQISPYEKNNYEIVDWMRNPINEYFSKKKMVPRKMEMSTDAKDFIDGYQHMFENIRFNKKR